jgi:hypothetical protein
MMKWVLVALTVCVVSLLGVLPAAAETMPCDQTTIPSLADCVQHAAQMGNIDNQGVVNSLLAETSAARAALNRRDKATAINILNAFIHDVQAEAGQHIDATYAEHMVMHAQNVIKALGG